jgi:ABC-type multidrug transport system fused ATPase/permease subunit
MLRSRQRWERLMVDAEVTGEATVPGGEALHGRLIRLEEALVGVRSVLGAMQWAGGFVLTIVVLIVGALLARSFTVGDQIAELTAVSRETGAKVTLLQGETAEAKADLREFRAEAKADLREFRAEAKAELRDVHAELAAIRTSLERLAARIETPQRTADDRSTGDAAVGGATAIPPGGGGPPPPR